MLTEGFVARKTRPNPYELPDDHPIAWLAEAQQLYQHQRLVLPPFVEKNQGHTRAGSRRNVTLRVTDDLQQELPIEAEMTCWSWSPYYTFCTIDIGGQRLIVKGNSFDHYPSYRSWLGPKEGFSYQPVAFGPWQRYIEDDEGPNRTQYANPVGTLSNPIPLGSSVRSDTVAEEISTNNQCTPQPERRAPSFPPRSSPTLSSGPSPSMSSEFVTRQERAQEQQQYIDKEDTAQAASLSTKDSPRLIQAKTRDIQASAPTAHHNSQHYVETPTESAPISRPKNDASSPNRREEHPPKRPSEPVQVSPSQDIPEEYPEIQEDRNLPSNPNKDVVIETQRKNSVSTERTNQAAIDRQPYGNNAVASTARKPQYQGQHPSEPILHAAIETQRKNSVSTERTNGIAIDRQPYGNNANVPTTHRPQYQQQHPSNPISLNQPTKRPSEPTSLNHPPKRKRQPSIPNPPNLASPHPTTAPRSQSTRSSPRNPSPFSPNPSRSSTPTTSLPSQSTLLPPHILSRTTLFVAIPLSTDSVPLKLRSCPSLDSFFKNVLAISISAQGQSESTQDEVSGIRASFDWKKETDKDRNILLKREVEDSWEVFLEIVELAPCWGVEGGRCMVGCEVVLV